MTDVCREILVALPDVGGDIYRQHQHVWTVMHGKAKRGGSSFCYAMRSPHLAVVRSHLLDHGAVSSIAERPMRASIVTARQTASGLQALSAAEAPLRVQELLATHGIVTADVAVLEQSSLTGCKCDRETGQSMRIVLPVSVVQFVPRFSNAAKAHLAWRDGIGRGKRFGCGMLQLV